MSDHSSASGLVEQAASVRALNSLWDLQIDEGPDSFVVSARAKPTPLELACTPVALTLFFNAFFATLALAGTPIWKTQPVTLIVVVYSIYVFSMLACGAALWIKYRDQRRIGVYCRGQRASDGSWSIEVPPLGLRESGLRPVRLRHLVGTGLPRRFRATIVSVSVAALDTTDDQGREQSLVLFVVGACPPFIRRPRRFEKLSRLLNVVVETRRGLNFSIEATSSSAARTGAR